MDTRGEGGYLLLPYSNTRKGPYRVNANPPQGAINGWVLDLLGTTPERNTDKRERRASARATASAVEFSGATNGLHPYAAAAFTNRIGEFRALAGSGNGRTDLLTRLLHFVASWVGT